MRTNTTPGADKQGPARQGEQEMRFDNLLPNDGTGDDGRFQVAEEVSLDQQSDTARRVGEAAPGAAGDAVAEALRAGKPAPGGAAGDARSD